MSEPALGSHRVPLDGQVHAQPWHSIPHVVASSALVANYSALSGRVMGGGGWWILSEPEIHFKHNLKVSVPDLAGWRRERMSSPPKMEHRFEVVPDWVCEILIPFHGELRIARSRCLDMPVMACRTSG